jgi:hypothetical protein
MDDWYENKKRSGNPANVLGGMREYAVMKENSDMNQRSA